MQHFYVLVPHSGRETIPQQWHTDPLLWNGLRLCSTYIRERPQLFGWLKVLASCTSTMECQASYFPDGYLLLVRTPGYSAQWPDCHGDTPVSDDTGQREARILAEPPQVPKQRSLCRLPYATPARPGKHTRPRAESHGCGRRLTHERAPVVVRRPRTAATGRARRAGLRNAE